MDACFPGKVSLAHVNFNAYLAHEITRNYKLLQKMFTQCDVHKHIDAEVLSKGRFIENLEILQWFKCFYESNGCSTPLSEYHARERRQLFGVAEPRPPPGSARKNPATARRASGANMSVLMTPGTRAGTSSMRRPALKSTRTPIKPRVLAFAPSPPPTKTAAPAPAVPQAAAAAAAATTTTVATGAAGEEEAGAATAFPTKRARTGQGEWEIRGLLAALQEAEQRAAVLEQRLRSAERVCTDVLARSYPLDEAMKPDEAASHVAGRVLDALFSPTERPV